MNILLIDDHPLFRSSVATVVKELGENIVSIEANSCEEAIKIINKSDSIDLILLDLNLGGMDGLSGLRLMRDADPSVPIVIISAVEDSAKIKKCINAGAMGYIPKSSSREIILNALRLVMSGGTYVPPHLFNKPKSKNRNSTADGLTLRQYEVLNLLVKGEENKEIAYKLGMAENTVRVHVAAILKLLGAKNRTEAGYAAINLGLLEDMKN